MNRPSFKHVFLLAAGLALAGGIALLLLSVWKPPVPVAVIRIVDEQGRPVAGATVMPDGLRPKNGGAHYSWRDDYPRGGVKAASAQTDREGYARVAYPYYTYEKLETGQISFAVDHPDFCADRPFRTVASSPPANAPLREKARYFGLRLLRRVQSRPDPVVLRRGGIVRLTGYIGTKENVVTNLYAEISHQWPAGTNFWRHDGPAVWSRKLVPGPNVLRAIHFPATGPTHFSEPEVFQAAAGKTNEFFVALKPGTRVAGRLDDSVPRPVQHGRVCAEVFVSLPGVSSADAPEWHVWQPVAADGTFVFESLPPGQMEIIGCVTGLFPRTGQHRPRPARDTGCPRSSGWPGRSTKSR